VAPAVLCAGPPGAHHPAGRQIHHLRVQTYS
jgi:hypothetical protein